MKRILLIEDDSAERELFKVALERAGYEVLEAPNGEVGLQMFQQQPCEVVITDIFMPEKEGLETILTLKKDYPSVKIIAISGGGVKSRYAGKLGAETALQAAQEFGALHTLEKPIALKKLVAIVNELF